MFVTLAWVLLAAAGCGQQNPSPTTPAAEPAPEATKEDHRTQLNLLGQTDAKSGESRRNENVPFNLIDNNALKEINQRLGVTPTVLSEFQPERNYYGSEFGTAPGGTILLTPKPSSGWHGQMQWMHLNSVFSARAFFQVGPSNRRGKTASTCH